MIKLPTCPICNKVLVGEAARESDFLPFCSERCRRVDLFRWCEGKYAIDEPLAQLPDDLNRTTAGEQSDHDPT